MVWAVQPHVRLAQSVPPPAGSDDRARVRLVLLLVQGAGVPEIAPGLGC
jgi:hypothetical protein